MPAYQVMLNNAFIADSANSPFYRITWRKAETSIHFGSLYFEKKKEQWC